jgi:hypothetical protein
METHPRLKNIQPVHPSSQLPGEPDIPVYSLIFCTLLPAAGAPGRAVQSGWKHQELADFYKREKQGSVPLCLIGHFKKVMVQRRRFRKIHD